eukprot:TRINITY_DN918_c1_g1_i2.p1 TRINITY_DN918_c1_g1~~TRINITY_DN918_c1_g1_i2.p1  ORF type:complete len:220 (-),score=106.10 TRINITY_DN918_c1_g1_i2:52-711(-)
MFSKVKNAYQNYKNIKEITKKTKEISEMVSKIPNQPGTFDPSILNTTLNSMNSTDPKQVEQFANVIKNDLFKQMSPTQIEQMNNAWINLNKNQSQVQNLFHGNNKDPKLMEEVLKSLPFSEEVKRETLAILQDENKRKLAIEQVQKMMTEDPQGFLNTIKSELGQVGNLEALSKNINSTPTNPNVNPNVNAKTNPNPFDLRAAQNLFSAANSPKDLKKK